MKTSCTLLFIAALLASDPAFALRCGNKLVSDGDPKAKILKYCGEPESVEYQTIYRSGFPRMQPRDSLRAAVWTIEDRELLYHDRSVVEVQVEEWTYNFGPRRLMRLIRFENGFVTEVIELGYGYND